jgi:hypothetical protein
MMTPLSPKLLKFSRRSRSETGPLNQKVARKRAKRTPVTSNVPGRAADPARQSSRLLRARTAEDIANEQTAEQLALRIWAAIVAQKVLNGMSALMDELIQSHLLDDDDEEADEGWLDDHHKREKRFLDEAISDGLDRYPDFDAINNLPPSSDPDIARDTGQLKDVLSRCAIGATEFKGKFSRAQLERMVKRDLATRFKKDLKYSQHVREDVPGLDVKAYGSRAPRPRGRSPKLPITRAAAGWPRCSPAGGCVSPRIVSTQWPGRISLDCSGKPRASTGGITS